MKSLIAVFGTENLTLEEMEVSIGEDFRQGTLFQSLILLLVVDLRV
jgi:hypothetical protein